MSSKRSSGRGLARLLLFEGLALAGLAALLFRAPGGDRTTLLFFYNALVFLVLYPLLYLYKWTPLPGFFRFLLTPLNIVLHAAILFSTFLWAGMFAYLKWAPTFPVLVSNAFILLAFWAVLYLAWLRYVLGVTLRYLPLGPLMGLTMIVTAGGVAGFFAGRWVVERWGVHIGSGSTQFLTWVLVVLIGMTGGAVLAPKHADDPDD